ncbi:hypothetical protein SAY86_029094 [Trapa natans]|uniref:AB hydrolase-1 domain-containing protein n=1 Tax=Trapa natans TaxID=22666 RepID=A0AAN7LVX2_TRANT|nr:hypothetical protein SAY86_029094 [Trapa natans]
MALVRSASLAFGVVINVAVSFVVFSFLDLLDRALCYVYRAADYMIESEWKPCYCSSPLEAIDGGGGGSSILVTGQGEPAKVVRLSSSRLQLEDVSDTLYSRPPLVADVSKATIRRLSRGGGGGGSGSCSPVRPCHKARTGRPGLRVSSDIVEMLKGRIVGMKPQPTPRWSDCSCKVCTSWTASTAKSLFVRSAGAKAVMEEDVIFIHGFISSSRFWSETVYPNLSETAKSIRRFFAVDLLGFGRSPRPTDSLYTLSEHVEMIEKSVLDTHKVKSFHVVAHSLGCILALALAVRHPQSVKSLTLLAPPYYPVPEGEVAKSQYVMRKVAPRRVWPLIAFGASIASWYEHISRTVCLLICKNHRLWEFLHKLLSINSIPMFLLEGFFCHTHDAAWHTLHNVICGTAGKIDGYLDTVNDSMKCEVNIFHGEHDELIPLECSYNVQRKVPRAKVRVVEKEDHITVLVGREKAFVTELERIWNGSDSSVINGHQES